MSNTTIPNFPSWEPPDVEDLDFASNCTLVASYFDAWFDIESEPYPGTQGLKKNVEHWVPQAQDAAVTEKYFRQALPADLRDIPTYGEILDWERALRSDFAAAVRKLSPDDKSTDVDSPYFRSVVRDPAEHCVGDTICNVGFEWDRLGDLNGPGMLIFFHFQAAVATFYCLIVGVEGLRKFRNVGRPHPPARPRQASSLDILYRSVTKASKGFSDTVLIFAAVLPVALLIQYKREHEVVVSRDIILGAWILAGNLVMSLWVSRIDACIHRLKAIRKAGEPRPIEPVKEINLISAIVVFVEIFAIQVVLVVFAVRGSTDWDLERFTNGICHLSYATLLKKLALSIGSVVVYAALRVGVWYCRLRLIEREYKQKFGRENPEASEEEQRNFLSGLRKNASEDDRLRRLTDYASVVDVWALAAPSWTLVVIYTQTRGEVLKLLGLHWFTSNWNLGQVLATSTIVAMVSGYLRCLSKTRKIYKEHRDPSNVLTDNHG